MRRCGHRRSPRWRRAGRGEILHTMTSCASKILPMMILCLPHAGGTAAAFRGWQEQLGVVAQVVALEPAGGGARRGEAPATSMAELVAAQREHAIAAARAA